MATYTICGKCKADLAEVPAGHPCPECGEESGRIIGVEMMETLGLSVGLGFRHKRPGMKKPLAEGLSGVQAMRDGSGRRVKKVWYIDRDRNPPWYYEEIRDADTDELLRPVCSEPLADHVGHGSAKSDSKEPKK